jgi:hypothetical protein
MFEPPVLQIEYLRPCGGYGRNGTQDGAIPDPSSSWSLVRFIIAVTGDEMRKEKKILGDMYIRMSHILEFIRTNVPRSNSVGHNILMDVAGLASQSHADVQIGDRSNNSFASTWYRR